MILFINASFREGSRTLLLAKHYLNKRGGEVTAVELGDMDITPLNRQTLKTYNEAVSAASYDNKMFEIARQFASADEIVIAAPFYNFSFPAILHSYLELVCTQGINFNVDADGSYYTLCKAKKLTYITTAGGYIPDNDYAFGYIKYLCGVFWGISDIDYYKADGIDIKENNAELIIEKAMSEIDENHP